MPYELPNSTALSKVNCAKYPQFGREYGMLPMIRMHLN